MAIADALTAVSKREAARRAAETRRRQQQEKRNATYQRALDLQTLRQEQRDQIVEAEENKDDGHVLEPGYAALLKKSVKAPVLCQPCLIALLANSHRSELDSVYLIALLENEHVPAL